MNFTQIRYNYISLIFILSTAVTLWGLAHLDWSFALLSAKKIAIYAVVGLVVIEVFVKLVGLGRLATGVIIACFLAVFANAIWPLLVTLWFALSSYLLGHAIISKFIINGKKIHNISAFLVGAGSYGTVIGLIAHYPINYPGLYVFGLLAPLIIWRHSIGDIYLFIRNSSARPDEFKWLDTSIVLVSLLYFSVAFMPEIGADALAMHLFIPGHLASRHEWGFDVTTYVWAVLPTTVDWIYSLVYMLAGETSVRLLNACFVFVLSWLLRDLVLWAGGTAFGARWAVLVFLSTPLVFLEASSLYIELIWSAFIVSGTLMVFRSVSSNGDVSNHLPVAGLLFGCALASKPVTFSFLPAVLLLLLVRYKFWIRINLSRVIFMSLILFSAIGFIPYVTAWYYTGNPVFPFFNEIFQASQYPAVNFSAPSRFEKGVSWDTFYNITFETNKYLQSKPGGSGFQWLLLLLPAMVVLSVSRHRRGLALCFIGVVAVIFTFHQTAYLRYVLPSSVILTAAIGVCISLIFSEDNSVFRRFVLVVTVSSIFLNLIFFKSATYYGNINLRPMMSATNRYEYLQNKRPIRNAVSLVNQLNVDRMPVAVFAPPLTAGLFSDALYSSWYNHVFQSLVKNSLDAEAISDVLVDYGVDYIILDDHWGTSDKRSIIMEATDEVLDFGRVSVRSLNEKYIFKTELLEDGLTINGGHWLLSEGVKMIHDGVVVSKDYSAKQAVRVMPGRKYKLTVKARCFEGVASGRLQVNWKNARSEFIRASIDVFECSLMQGEYSMEIISPPSAVKAVVYATGHTDAPIVVNEVSFK